MVDPNLSDMEKVIVAILQNNGKMNLRTLASRIGSLKEHFENNPADVPSGMESLASCVDDVPRSLRKLQDRNLVIREGSNPKEWKYVITEDGKKKEVIPADSARMMMDTLGKIA